MDGRGAKCGGGVGNETDLRRNADMGSDTNMYELSVYFLRKQERSLAIFRTAKQWSSRTRVSVTFYYTPNMLAAAGNIDQYVYTIVY